MLRKTEIILGFLFMDGPSTLGICVCGWEEGISLDLEQANKRGGRIEKAKTREKVCLIEEQKAKYKERVCAEIFSSMKSHLHSSRVIGCCCQN